MKYLVMLCDGMADYPIDALDGKTPLEAAETPCMDKLAETAKVGLVKTVADGAVMLQTFLFLDMTLKFIIQDVLPSKPEASVLI